MVLEETVDAHNFSESSIPSQPTNKEKTALAEIQIEQLKQELKHIIRWRGVQRTKKHFILYSSSHYTPTYPHCSCRMSSFYSV